MNRIFMTPKIKGYENNLKQIASILNGLKDLETETLIQHFTLIDTDGETPKNGYNNSQLLVFNKTSPNNNVYFIIHQLETQRAADLLYQTMIKESQLLDMNKIYK